MGVAKRAKNGVKAFWELAAHPQPHTILIAGVGEGREICQLRELMPNSTLIGAEPLWHYVQKLRGRFPGQLFPVALGASRGTGALHLGAIPSQRASLCPLPGLGDEKTETCEIRTLADIWGETGPWGPTLLWLDAEGSELSILVGASQQAMDEVYWINIEVNMMPLRDSPAFCAVHRYLGQLGFRPAGIHSVNGSSADFVYLRESLWIKRREALLELALAKKRQEIEEQAT